ncbi:hypothetical protein BDV98DRAFT_502223 [Pterulicium gracile]|uniref:YCII-related domain-containing protein n=1 Tax=Pterulicium gracile TaxID=1884261 RepID=A0A5C3QS01_9AGAR|nr:hypothetical protein BDV98DRAFT_502223 [Pterula gracilis]
MSSLNFFVYAPDKTEEGTFQKRLAVREQHLVVARENIASKKIRFGGALLNEESLVSEEKKKLIGSTFVISAVNMEEARKFVQDDIYYTTGVWDADKVVITPFMAATGFPE